MVMWNTGPFGLYLGALGEYLPSCGIWVDILQISAKLFTSYPPGKAAHNAALFKGACRGPEA